MPTLLKSSIRLDEVRGSLHWQCLPLVCGMVMIWPEIFQISSFTTLSVSNMKFSFSALHLLTKNNMALSFWSVGFVSGMTELL